VAGRPADLEARLREIAREGALAWPGLALDPTVFIAFVAERVPKGSEPLSALASLHTNDLFLACACAERVAGAVARFEVHFASGIDAFTRRVRGSSSFTDDIKQILSDKLFVSADGQPPKIASYSGRGALASWVGVSAQRIALRLTQNQERMPSSDPLGDALPSGANPEMDYLKARYLREFRAVFQATIAELTRRERVILRLHFVNGLSQDRIAKLYGVNQSQVSRWITNAREAISHQAELELQKRLNVGVSEIRSIAELIRSQFDLSLARCLGDEQDLDSGEL